jgi:hypothetical protein
MGSPMNELPRTFVLGLGAQKAATSWVHRYLRHYPEASLGAIKEYHIWDVLRVPELGYFSPLTPAARAKSLARLALGRSIEGDRLRRRFCQAPESYFDYFAGLLQRPGIRLTGDITPSYGALPAEALREIRAGMEARGATVRAIFLMRDPVERSHSAVRMHKRDRRNREGVDIRLDDDAALRRYVAGEEARLRGDYARTLAVIDAVFASDEVFFGFYETIFTEGEVRRLSAFFGVQPDLDFVANKVNVSARGGALAPETVRAVQQVFADTYAVCAERFPVTREIWAQPT